MSNNNLSKTKNQIIEVMIITDLDHQSYLDRNGNILNSFQVLGRGIAEDMASNFREDFFRSPTTGTIIGTALGGSSSLAQGLIAANVSIFETAQVMPTPGGLASSSTSSASARSIADPS